MLAALLAARLAARGIHYAWVVAALAFCSMLTTSAALGLPGALLLPLSKEFGWSTDQISSALALRFILFGLMAPFSAMLMERFGLRRVIFSALALVGSALLLSTQMSNLWHLFVLWGVTLGIGSGLTAMVLGAVVANRWFTARRGLVIGMLSASTATGQLLFLPLAAWIIQHLGWRYAMLPVFCVGLALAVLILRFIADRPSSLGLRPYGEVPGAAAAGGGPAVPATIWSPFIVLREAMGKRMFWVLAGTFFICGLSTSGLIQTHFITLCADFGLAAVPAASMLAMMGALDFVGTIASGWLSDRYAGAACIVAAIAVILVSLPKREPDVAQAARA